MNRRDRGEVEHLIELHLRAIVERLDGMDKANELDAKVIEHRLEELNNLRHEYTNDRGGFVTVTQFNTELKHVGARVDDNAQRLGRMEGSGVGSRAMWGYVVGVVGLLVAIGTLIVLLTG